MRDQIHPPRQKNETILEGGTKLGKIWENCKSRKRCVKPPYDRLLTNLVLRADYRSHPAARARECCWQSQ